MSPKCPFCSVPKGRIIYATDHAIAFYDGFPISEGHALVVPTKHVASIYDLSGSEQAHLWFIVGRVRTSLRKKFHPDGFNIGLNDGPAAGQTMMHTHIFISITIWMSLWNSNTQSDGMSQVFPIPLIREE